MSKITMTCRFCSAPLDITEGSMYADCPYCGKKQPIVDNPFPGLEKAVPPKAAPEEKSNVVVIQKTTHHNWGILGGCLGVAVILIVVFVLVRMSGKSDTKRSPEPQPATAVQVKKEPVKTDSPKDVYQPQTVVDTSDSERAYWQTKQEAAIANRRYAQAWRMVPANLRNALQRQISDLPGKVDQKCKTYSHGFAEGYPRKWAYLQCSVNHENVLSGNIERYASDLKAGLNPDFLDYVDPVGFLEMPIR